jgi:hypothetical protein
VAENQVVTIQLEDGPRLAVAVEATRGQLVADRDIVGKLEGVTSAIEHVGHEVLETVKKIAPSAATVELDFGIALEQGQLIALFGKAKGEATIKVTLQWTRGG